MTKTELIKKLASQTGLTQYQAGETITILNRIIEDNVARGEETCIGGLTVAVAERAARIGRNPSTGEQMNIPAKRVISVRASAFLKDAANRSKKA